MANPSILNAPTKLYCPAEPDGRLFQAGEPWPGDAWTAERGGKPVGRGATAQAMKDLIDAQDTIDSLSAQLSARDHDMAVLAAERDAANGKVSELEQRAIEAERGQVEASARVADFMRERDAAREDFHTVSDQVAAANTRITELEREAAKVPGLVEQLNAANQTIADLNGKLEAAKPADAPKKPAKAAAQADPAT